MHQYLSPLQWWISPLKLSEEQLRKRVYFILVLLLLTPLSLLYGITYHVRGELGLVTVLCYLSALNGIVCLMLLRYIHDIQVAVRVGMAYALLFISILLAVGAGDGSTFCWFYFFPATVYYVYGMREGSYWVVVSCLVAIAFGYLNLGTYSYAPGVGLRFVFSYIQISLLTCGMEYSRQHYYDRLIAEKRNVENALQEVSTLQSLLPICGSCKKVRDDTGYWHQVETYMRDHAGMEFSHGICPNCRQKMIDELYAFKAARAVEHS